MTEQQFLRSMDELFELNPGTVGLLDNFRDIEGWSSLTFLGLIAMVDAECGVKLSPTDVLSSTTVKDLLQLVSAQSGPGKAAA